MKLITITGPHASGKDSIIRELLRRVPNLKKALFITTRQPRRDETPNVDALYTTPEKFEEMKAKGEFVYFIKLHDYQVGTPWSEINKAESLILNIILDAAKYLEKQVSNRGGKVFKVAVNAPYEQRKSRAILREQELPEEEVIKKLVRDPRSNIESTYSDFDLIVENLDGQFEQTVGILEQAILKFLNN